MNGLQKLQIVATIAVTGFLLWRFGGLATGLSFLPMLLFLLVFFYIAKSSKKNWEGIKKTVATTFKEQAQNSQPTAGNRNDISKILSFLSATPQADQIMKVITGHNAPQDKTVMTVMPRPSIVYDKQTISWRILGTIIFIVIMLLTFLISAFGN